MSKTNPDGSKRRSSRKLLVVVLLLIVLIPIGYMIYVLQKTNYDNKDDANIIVNEEIAQGDISNGYRNFVLFGVDSRSNSLTSDTRSDTIMIVSINNKTKDVKLCSIYRDTYVNIPNSGYTKINHAFAKGGYALALSTINTNFDLDLTQYVTVNFYAVTKVVDLLGGITLDITEEELKWLNGYVKENNKVNGTSVPGLEHAGTQVVNGTQALAYSRIRYTAGGDFKRTERQRIVVDQVFNKAKNADAATILRIVNELLPEISTNIPTSEILVLAKDLLRYTIKDSVGFPFQKTTGYIQRVSYVLPIDLERNVKELHQYLFDEEDFVPSSKVVEYSNYIKSLGY